VSVPDGNGDPARVGDPGAAPPVVAPPTTGEKRPIGVVVASAVNGVKTLLRQHVELAKLEAGEAAATRGMGAGMMGAAVLLGLFAVGFAAASGAAGLAIVLPTWAANLIVAGVFALATLVLLTIGRNTVKAAPSVERTRDMLKEDARWAKRQIAR
jgi:putative superfamily III holin-X